MRYLSIFRFRDICRLWSIVAAINLIAPANISAAGPITFNSALPISEGMGVLRSQIQMVRKSGDATAQNRDVTVVAVPLVLAYGISPKLALFGVLPYVNKRMDISMGTNRIRRSMQGLGDAMFLPAIRFINWIDSEIRYVLHHFLA
ncbi:MAG: hypothetical protein ACE5DZ_03040 [Mariprofundus sp.]